MSPKARPANLLLIAARTPTPGATKTRLGATIGMERAAALYRAFLVDLAVHFQPRPDHAPAYDLGWAFTPADADFRAVLTQLGCPIPAGARWAPQVGGDWGERQRQLLQWGAEHGYAATVLLASDSPQLPPATATDAFAALATHDVVIGRVRDGGYYLIGLRGFVDVLSGVPMSTDRAADAVITQAQAQGLRVAELAPSFDVDDAVDLVRLIAALAPDGAAAPATWAALHRLGLAE
jgi:rSAM/selenodomain-associated transferase 1